jgi:hypothetical protein
MTGVSPTKPLGNSLVTMGGKSLTSTPKSCKIQLTTTKVGKQNEGYRSY